MLPKDGVLWLWATVAVCYLYVYVVYTCVLWLWATVAVCYLYVYVVYMCAIIYRARERERDVRLDRMIDGQTDRQNRY